MNNRNVGGKSMNVRYKRNSYARKRMKIIIAICALALVALAVILIIIGNTLKDKSDGNLLLNDNTQNPSGTEPPPHASVGSVNGYAVSLEGLTSSDLYTRLSEIKKTGGNSVCYTVRADDGSEIFKSSVAQDNGKQAAGNDYISAKSLADRAEDRELHSSAVVDVYSFSEKDAAKRSVKLAYDAAIGAELAIGGIDDVIFRVSSISADNIEELCQVAESAKKIHSEAIIGISIPMDTLEGEGSEILIDRLWQSFDFLAFDMTKRPDKDADEYITKNVEAAYYYLLRYNARVLLPSADTEALAEIIEALTAKNISNWQTVA